MDKATAYYIAVTNYRMQAAGDPRTALIPGTARQRQPYVKVTPARRTPVPVYNLHDDRMEQVMVTTPARAELAWRPGRQSVKAPRAPRGQRS